jgi:hypothetical protein
MIRCSSPARLQTVTSPDLGKLAMVASC